MPPAPSQFPGPESGLNLSETGEMQCQQLGLEGVGSGYVGTSKVLECIQEVVGGQVVTGAIRSDPESSCQDQLGASGGDKGVLLEEEKGPGVGATPSSPQVSCVLLHR